MPFQTLCKTCVGRPFHKPPPIIMGGSAKPYEILVTLLCKRSSIVYYSIITSDPQEKAWQSSGSAAAPGLVVNIQAVGASMTAIIGTPLSVGCLRCGACIYY